MLSLAEKARYKEIKQLTLEGRVDLVSTTDKQWVLDIVRREQVAIPVDAVRAAAAQGYDTAGVAMEGA